MRSLWSRLPALLPPLVLAALGLTLLAPTRSARADDPRIVIEVQGLRSDRGRVLGALYRSPEGWTERGREAATCVASILAARARCVLEAVPAGLYAFAFLHDENTNGGLDRDFFGWPQEGFGFSNDAAPGLGPPSFESARFTHDGAATALRVHARYGL
jgi:uncharacterized protein (DUF2141 family)